MITDAKTIDFTVSLQNPFPSYQTVLDQIKPILLKEKILGVLFIDCGEFRWIEQFFGRQMHAHIIDVFIEITKKLAGKMIRHEDIITSNYPNQYQFFIFLSPKRPDRHFYSTDMEEMAIRVKKHINDGLKMRLRVVFPVRHWSRLVSRLCFIILWSTWNDKSKP
jgi:hypothetical protein